MSTPDGTMLYFNRQATTYSGSRGRGARHWDWLSLVHPDQTAHAHLAWAIAVGAATSCHLDLRLRRFDGRHRWHAVHRTPIHDVDGALIATTPTRTSGAQCAAAQGFYLAGPMPAKEIADLVARSHHWDVD